MCRTGRVRSVGCNADVGWQRKKNNLKFFIDTYKEFSILPANLPTGVTSFGQTVILAYIKIFLFSCWEWIYFLIAGITSSPLPHYPVQSLPLLIQTVEVRSYVQQSRSSYLRTLFNPEQQIQIKQPEIINFSSRTVEKRNGGGQGGSDALGKGKRYSTPFIHLVWAAFRLFGCNYYDRGQVNQ